MNINPEPGTEPKTICKSHTCVYHACMSDDCQRKEVFEQNLYLGQSNCSLGKLVPGDVFFFVRKRKLKIRVHQVRDFERIGSYEYTLEKEGYNRVIRLNPLDMIGLVNKGHISKFAFEFL